MAKGKRTKEDVENATLGGFAKTLRSDKWEKRNGKPEGSKTAIDHAIENGEAHALKKATEEPKIVGRFIPLAPGFYGKDYVDVDGHLIDTAPAKKSKKSKK